MITEAAAKTKWCPFARAISNYGIDSAVTAVNRDGANVDRDCLCVASACMAWRVRLSNDTGYCGLAGGPTS